MFFFAACALAAGRVAVQVCVSTPCRGRARVRVRRPVERVARTLGPQQQLPLAVDEACEKCKVSNEVTRASVTRARVRRWQVSLSCERGQHPSYPWVAVLERDRGAKHTNIEHGCPRPIHPMHATNNMARADAAGTEAWFKARRVYLAADVAAPRPVLARWHGERELGARRRQTQAGDERPGSNHREPMWTEERNKNYCADMQTCSTLGGTHPRARPCLHPRAQAPTRPRAHVYMRARAHTHRGNSATGHAAVYLPGVDPIDTREASLTLEVGGLGA